MALSAFTNERGHHYRSAVKVNSIRGHTDGFNQDSDEFKGVLDAFSFKSDLIRSDRINPTAYGRAITNITEDQPLVFSETRFRDDGTIKAEHTFTRYLSPDYPTMFMSPPKSFYVKWENARKRSVTECLNDLRTMKAQFGADLAESIKTADMVAYRASVIWRDLLAIKHGRHRYGGPQEWWDLLSGKTLSNMWLELVYGWLPLMGSIRDGMQWFSEVSKGPEHYIRATKSTRINDQEVYVTGDRRTQTWVSTGRRTSTMYAYVNSQGLSDVDQAGLLNPLEIAWELVPWSFVVDWGIPVGSWLQALSATAGLTFLRGYESATQMHSFRVHMKANPHFYSERQPGRLRLENLSFQRSPYGSFPLPELYGKENPFSTPHVINAVALFRQLFR